jgi:malonate-semialdehyde dehydrogenase (acetylating)/methylmalonate-semialdehyde dehydrogenase
MVDQFERLAQVVAMDQGKHITEARGEIRRVIEIVEMACGIPALIQGGTFQNLGGNVSGRIIRAPLGVFCGIAPFNFPALVFGWFVPFAIGTGNTFVFKPSPESPLFMQEMGKILNEVGIPDGVVNIVHGGKEVADAWYDQDSVAGICLVGSTPTAKSIATACGRSGKKCMLLGGAKNFLVAMEDADIDALVDGILSSGFGAAGQRCLASSNIAIAETIYDTVVDRLVEASSSLVVGDATDPDVTVGPVISAAAKQRIEQAIATAVDDGAVLVLDGRQPRLPAKNSNGYFVGPTILKDVTPQMAIAQEEVFGPVLGLIKIRNLDEALAMIEGLRAGNGACIFTQNLYCAERFIEEADVGMIGVNVGISAPHPYMPFGGIKDSLIGNNKTQGKGAIDFFTQDKVVTVRVLCSDEGGMLDAGTDRPLLRSCTAI